MHIITAAAVTVFTFLRAVFLSAALPKAKPGPERGVRCNQSSAFNVVIYINSCCLCSDLIVLESKIQTISCLFTHFPSPKCCVNIYDCSRSQTCSSVAVSNSNQTANGPLATFLGCHVEHTLHLQKQ